MVWLIQACGAPGPQSIDRFATADNRLPLAAPRSGHFCSQFYHGDPEAADSEWTDALTVSWEGENNWVFSPSRLLVAAVSQLRASGACRPLGSMGSVVASQSYDLGPGPGIGWPGVRDVAGVNPRRLVADCLYGSSGYLERSCRCDMIAVRFGCTACASGGSNPAPRGPYALFSARRGVIPRRLKRVDAPGELRFRPPS